MRRREFLALALAIVAAAGIAHAADKPDPTGTWKWSVTFNDQKRDMTLKLKLNGDKFSGSMVGRDGTDRAIDDPVFKDGEVSFSVTRERNGMKTRQEKLRNEFYHEIHEIHEKKRESNLMQYFDPTEVIRIVNDI